MNNDEIIAFLTVIDKMSFTKAAQKLYIAQSTLSSRLASLEKEIGGILIERRKGSKDIILTARGQQFFMATRNWQTFMDDVEEIRRPRVEGMRLNIGSVDTFKAFVLPELYKRLINAAPPLRLNIRTYNSAELYDKVNSGDLDVAFTLLNLPFASIEVKAVYEEPRVVLRCENSPTSKKIISQDELDLKKEIYFIGDEKFNIWYRNWHQNYPLLQVDTVQLLSSFMCEEGLWSIVPRSLAEAVCKTGGYNFYHLREPVPKRICYRIQPKNPSFEIAARLEIFDSIFDGYFDNPGFCHAQSNASSAGSCLLSSAESTTT